ncbi:uncharacterized protein LOC134718150 [Mytilus trossulus]|uniref:uncharacterized protein LOC134718150 n=1 Tax=Mytilus trossulus TaxID=6551 RepID=UPI003005DECF
MDYSPFKDYLNFSSLLFKEREEHVEKTTELLSETEVDYWANSISSIEDILSSEPFTSDSFSDEDLDVFENMPDATDNNMMAVQIYNNDQDQLCRSDSLSSGETASSGENSFSDEGYSSDYLLSAFLRQLNGSSDNMVQAPLQYQIMPAKPASEEKYCILCKRNGETREYYTTHVLKDNRGKVICPVLRKYVCPKCKATGDNAHTLRHCPFSDAQGSSTTETCYTLRSSCGRRRKKIA